MQFGNGVLDIIAEHDRHEMAKNFKACVEKVRVTVCYR
jgi:hypothetical protein